ncbi:MAG: T9SS type A sorting domain-containing protein [Ignavibacteria bacterium]|nr:T9SS type A sorting domain-containing protein [Ignavibacteria bacterium]
MNALSTFFAACTLIICLLMPVIITAQDGTLDPTFDVDGRVSTTTGLLDCSGTSMVIREDPLNPLHLNLRKIIVAGQTFNGMDSDFMIAQYNNDGSLDNSFGNNGIVITPVGGFDDRASAIVLQNDGKIVVAGASSDGLKESIAIVRYNSNGSLDLTFNTTGKVITSISAVADNASSVAVQNNGKILVAGFSDMVQNLDFTVVRYNSNGTLDNTFDTDGIVTTPIGNSNDIATKVMLQSDGKIVVTGSSLRANNMDFAMARYMSDGSLDLTFDSDGKVTTAINGSFNEYGFSGLIQNDGKILITGSSNSTFNDCIVARYNTDGSLDPFFGVNGIAITDFGIAADYGQAIDIALQKDDKIVVCGLRNDGAALNYAVVRYHVNGLIDSTFGTDGIVTTDFGSADDEGHAVAMQSDGKIVVAGGSHDGMQKRVSVARYNNPSVSPVRVEFDRIESDNSVTPNPFHILTTIRTANILQNATIEIHNSIGKKVRQVNGVNGQSFTLQRDTLPAGLYFIRVVQGYSILFSEKILIVD